MTRFRSNIVIEGSSQAFAEDHWGKIQIGNAEFFCPKKCARCKVITIDQEKGETLSGEPLKALAGFRMVDRQVLFGHNLQHDPKSANTIKVGDSLTVLA